MRTKIQEVEQRFNRSLADLLKDLYGEGFNQREIAEKLGVSQATISLWTSRIGKIATTKELVVKNCEEAHYAA